MKKISVILLLLIILFSVPAFAAENVVTPFDPDSPEGCLAMLVAEAVGVPIIASDNVDVAEAVNVMLDHPGTLLCADQEILFASLQGYTQKDLRTAMRPVFKIAASPLYLVMDSAVASELGITDIKDFFLYIEENEYELLLARHIDADVIDRAVTLLSNNLLVMTDYYLPDEIRAVLTSGEAQAAVISGMDLDAADEEVLPLCSLGAERTTARPDLPCAAELGLPVCQELAVYLFASVDISPENAEKVASVCRSIAKESVEAVHGFSYTPLSGEDLNSEISHTFEDYKKYMTEEGLFFYEE